MSYFLPYTIINISGPLPWMDDRRTRSKYSSGMAGFHEEVEDFFVYFSPTKEEKQKRAEAFERIHEVILECFPSAKVDTFGSSRIGYFLPTSDIDIRVLTGNGDGEGELEVENQRLVLKRILDALDAKKLIVEHRTKLLDGKLSELAVLKIQDKISTVNLDIVAKKVKGPDAATLIQSWFHKWPMAPKLFMVLKQFIVFHNLDGVYSGGLNSYSLIIMIVCFLRMTGKKLGWIINTTNKTPIRAKNFNLGQLLYEFLHYYGNVFDYQTKGLRIKDGGSVFDKKNNDQPAVGLGIGVLTIEDPLEENHNISGGTFCVSNVKQAFALAADVLVQPMKLYTHFFPDIGFLGRIVRISESTIMYRERIVQDFTKEEVEIILRSKPTSPVSDGFSGVWYPSEASNNQQTLESIPPPATNQTNMVPAPRTDSNSTKEAEPSFDYEWMSMYNPDDSD